jgi:uncharacterized cupin superfamily protein
LTEELLHLTERETVRVVRETPEELEVVGTWGPGGSPPPLHLHPAQDEEFEVLTGGLIAVIDGGTRNLASGDTLRIPRGSPHRMWNPSALADR